MGYALNVLVSLDQLANTLAGGNPDETVSSRLGRWAMRHGGPDRQEWGAWALYGALNWISPGHCERSIEKVSDG